MAVTASCNAGCSLDAGTLAASVPCEDTLSTSSFCHGIAGRSQDGYCRCDEVTFAASSYNCGEATWVDGFGLFVPEVLCRRSCGQCPVDSRPLWVPSCSTGVSNGDAHQNMVESSNHSDGMDHGGENSTFSEPDSGASWSHRLIFSALFSIAAIATMA